MNALRQIRRNASLGILLLLWINIALIVLRNVLRPEGIDLAAIVAAAVVGVAASVVSAIDRQGPTTRIVTSMAHAMSVAVLVFSFSGSSLQIDMHMYFFANMAICAVWVDWRSILAYAAFVAVHHTVLFFISSAAVFPGASDFSRVVLHATILILEAGVLLALIRSLTFALVSAEAATNEARAAQEAAAEMTRQTKAADLKMDADRRRLNSEAEAAAQARLHHATDGLAKVLRRLAAGDLSFQIDAPMSAEFEALRHDLNAAVIQLGKTLNAVDGAAGAIDDGSRAIGQSAGSLSERTERQAASLEETAAALHEITANLAQSSRRADEARTVASQANASALESGTVVASAIEAMRMIEESSKQVSNIIGLIDEIAFQTNLLALNAGVEAARAGEAGKGFAVVAQEVRTLAQNSARAAGEIKGLIRSSSVEVQGGVKLVLDTGAALKAIEGYIADVNAHVAAIATSAREQSTGLAELSAVVGQMDQVTQQNAAMVEETNSAAGTLRSQSATLRGLIGAFKLDAPPRRGRNPAHEPGRLGKIDIRKVIEHRAPS